MTASTETDVRRAPLPIFGKAFADGRRALLGWGIGIAAAIFLYLPLYPSMIGTSEMQKLIDSLPRALIRTLNYDQISTGAGYTQATVFGLIGFLLMSIASIGWGAAMLGGDEESGQLELTLAHGVTRVQVVVERFAALVLKVLLITALMFVLIALLNGPSQLGIDVGYLAQTCLLFAGLVLLCGSVAMLGGALTGRKVWGIGAGAFVAVVGYVFNALGNQSADLEWLHGLSPYYWAFGNYPMTNGAPPLALLAFYGGSLLVAAVTALVLRQRDIGV
ncbi:MULTISPECIES: ABC transporter permease subunit [Cryobacterium]|uniref:ABC transporter permease n=1 Tax=Cryobacterium glucosi TaxID=1259175 RepID=A0ABY2IS06_9MICO|nr:MULTISPECIES: ABC transporter permease subunit [Cryobacterium]MDY7529730.1 ABC transporter permease subunit [Cryobacterium sp. 10C2]MDY7558142.1 ABC transporter permease subunit [Cryobacterium sp. 10C3]MEB0001837.1 ABC transporter permease subunit [Cryobacterium sp. RTC2.1]MEB0202053.1 ABC transporter permease subunit [Cryobacterium sp. 5I3]MEB0286027.1 ABC transporter permease subunit [Cryobacterium sp. 10S3]